MADEILSPELAAINKVAEKVEGFQKKLGDKMDKSELKTVTDAIEEMKKGVASKEIVDAIKASMDKFQTQLEEMQEDVNTSKGGGKHKDIRKSIGQLFIEAIEKQKFDLHTVARKGAQHFNVTIDAPVQKVVGTMTTANVDAVGTNSIPFELADFEFGLTRIARRAPFLLQLANTSPISTMYAQWAEQENPEGAANETAEGQDKSQIDFDWVEKSQKVEKITAYIKVSKEALSDLPALRNEIDTELQELVLLEADADLWDGDGTTPTIKGITLFATAYSTPSGLTPTNVSEVIRCAIAQVVANTFMPNYIVMHPTDVAAMDLEKSGDDGHYMLPPFRSADGQVISGVRVVENLGVDQGDFLVGDFTKWKVRIREGFNIDVGLDGNDFTKNLVTILGEIRLVSYVKANHAGAFVFGTFADVIGS